MSIAIQPVLPKRRLSEQGVQDESTRYLRDFALRVMARMQVYPAQQPTNYVRTGAYGRSWRTRYAANNNSVDIYNNVRYAVYVGGSKTRRPGQARVMAGKGWVSIQDVADEERKRNLPKYSRVIWR